MTDLTYPKLQPQRWAFDVMQETPPVGWDQLFENVQDHPDSIYKLIESLDDISEKAARLSRYLEARRLGLKHDKAVKAQNTGAAKVRAGLGYTQHRSDITF